MTFLPNISDAVIAYCFLYLRGGVPSFGEKVERLTRPGVNGSDFRKQGIKGNDYQLQFAVDLPDGAGVEAQISALRALIGTQVEVELVSGSEIDNQILLDIAFTGIQDIGPCAGGVGANISPPYVATKLLTGTLYLHDGRVA